MLKKHAMEEKNVQNISTTQPTKIKMRKKIKN